MNAPITHCEWCTTTLATQPAMEIKTVTVLDKNAVTYTVGSYCCIRDGKRHADYVQEFYVRWNVLPTMYIDYRPDPVTVSILFDEAATDMRTNLNAFRNRLKTAWDIYDLMSPENQALVVCPQ
jgi:hypothetical protein